MHELQLDREARKPLSSQTGEIKLSLGGAGEGYLDSRVPGFTVVDLRDSPATDIVCDVQDLSRFETGSVEALYASNVLEHFPIERTVPVLKEWQRVLKPGSKLYVSVPDFDVAVKMYQKFGLTRWLKYHLWGDQKHPLNYHYICFTFATLSKDLYDAGFSDIKKVKFFGIGEYDGSHNVDTLSGEIISLNVIATK